MVESASNGGNATSAGTSNLQQVDQTQEQMAGLSLTGGPGASESQEVSRDAPLVFIVMGMAGSGKTTFVHVSASFLLTLLSCCLKRLISYLSQHGKAAYTVNLDPAVLEVAYPCNIDIRDSVKYKKVMKSYSLGPNGAILTCLNLFAAQFDQVINLIQNKQS